MAEFTSKEKDNQNVTMVNNNHEGTGKVCCNQRQRRVNSFYMFNLDLSSFFAGRIKNMFNPLSVSPFFLFLAPPPAFCSRISMPSGINAQF